MEATPYNVHDVLQATSLLTDEEEAVYSGNVYLCAGKCENVIVLNKSSRKVNRRPSQLKN